MATPAGFITYLAVSAHPERWGSTAARWLNPVSTGIAGPAGIRVASVLSLFRAESSELEVSRTSNEGHESEIATAKRIWSG